MHGRYYIHIVVNDKPWQRKILPYAITTTTSDLDFQVLLMVHHVMLPVGIQVNYDLKLPLYRWHLEIFTVTFVYLADSIHNNRVTSH